MRMADYSSAGFAGASLGEVRKGGVPPSEGKGEVLSTLTPETLG